MADETLQTFRVLKADAKLGVLFGFGIVCKERDAKTGQLADYYDDGSQSAPDKREHVAEAEMLKATADFMASARAIEEEHGGPAADGQVLFGFPLTEEIAKALGITTERTGFLVGVKASPDLVAKAERGELAGFSIFGTCRAEVVA